MYRAVTSPICVLVLSLTNPVLGPFHACSAETDKPDRTPGFRICERTTQPLLKAEKRWERDWVLGVNVIREGKRWRMWYAAYDKRTTHDDDEFFCYAESCDGVQWNKPNLGLVAYEGNKNNNILLARVAANYVFQDAGRDVNQKYKLIWLRFQPKEREPWWVYGGTSADGIHWHLSPKPLSAKNSDTQTVCIRDGDKYRLYTRLWRGGMSASNPRTIGYTQSDHFGDFPDPVEILGPDAQDPKGLDFYTNAATKLTDRLYVIMPAAFNVSDQTLRCHLAWSRDGVHFHRYGRTPVVNVGAQFDKMGAYVMPGAVPGDVPNTWWFYYFGTSDAHDYTIHTGGDRYNGGVGRFLLVVDDPAQANTATSRISK
jgi:hypothetical protein